MSFPNPFRQVLSAVQAYGITSPYGLRRWARRKHAHAETPARAEHGERLVRAVEWAVSLLDDPENEEGKADQYDELVEVVTRLSKEHDGDPA